MIRRVTIVAAAVLLGFLAWLPVPVSVGAQGGDAVYRSIRTEIPIAPRYLGTGTPTTRTWLRGDGAWSSVGLQDAASALRTSDISTTSSSYVTVMLASVTVGEAGDTVLVHVKGQLGKSGSGSCAFRVARGSTTIESWSLSDSTRILLDATFVDAPPVGTYNYRLQMLAQGSSPSCMAYRGDGAVPMPSLLVQSFYGGSIP